jgi:hypothetical protein
VGPPVAGITSAGVEAVYVPNQGDWTEDMVVRLKKGLTYPAAVTLLDMAAEKPGQGPGQSSPGPSSCGWIDPLDPVVYEIAVDDDLIAAVQRVAAFLKAAPLTSAIASLEDSLEGRVAAGVSGLTKAAGIDESLLSAAVKVRRDLGRLSDLIHAAAIALVLPKILRPGEQVKDFVHLAADMSGRTPELFVVREGPARFLRLTRSKAGWGLDRSPATQELFAARFGSLAMPISEFTAGPGARVQITDLTPLLPSVGVLPTDQGLLGSGAASGAVGGQPRLAPEIDEPASMVEVKTHGHIVLAVDHAEGSDQGHQFGKSVDDDSRTVMPISSLRGALVRCRIPARTSPQAGRGRLRRSGRSVAMLMGR